MIEGLLASLGLKHTERAGWRRVGIDPPESVAAHSWGMSLLALALAPEELDRGRLLAYCALHDLPECLTGDITPHDGVTREAKHTAEVRAFETLVARGLPPVLAETWHRYEAQDDDEARFVRELDRLDMALQALVYRSDADTAEFVASARGVVRHPALQPILDAIDAQLARDR